MHTLIVIGYMGIKRCYLDITLDEAKRRFTEKEEELPSDEYIFQFDFKDEFECYDVWKE